MNFASRKNTVETEESPHNSKKPSLAGQAATQLQQPALHPRLVEDEYCILKIQYMLVEDYVDYLKLTGLRLLKVRSESNGQAYNLQYSHECTQAPNVWMYCAIPGGIIFVHVTFAEPYFSVSFLFWNASQLGDHMYAEQEIPPKDLEEMRQIELLKNDLISRCHVHSFTYDFHLRMVSRYLTGGQQVLFNRGYNTNAFLIDFLQYYGCRPPFAQNCIYEERAAYQPLKVSAAAVWDHFLANEAQFGWEAIRIKNIEPNEYMLISKEQRDFSGQRYTLISIVLNETKPDAMDKQRIDLKLYVILVSEEQSECTSAGRGG